MSGWLHRLPQATSYLSSEHFHPATCPFSQSETPPPLAGISQHRNTLVAFASILIATATVMTSPRGIRTHCATRLPGLLVRDAGSSGGLAESMHGKPFRRQPTHDLALEGRPILVPLHTRVRLVHSFVFRPVSLTWKILLKRVEDSIIANGQEYRHHAR